MVTLNRVFASLAAVLICSLLAAFADSHEARIDSLRQEFNRTYSAGEADELAGLVAADAVWMPPGEPAVIGRDAIRACGECDFLSVSHCEY